MSAPESTRALAPGTLLPLMIFGGGLLIAGAGVALILVDLARGAGWLTILAIVMIAGGITLNIVGLVRLYRAVIRASRGASGHPQP